MAMGPCPKCRRHVCLSETACPFCGQPFGMTRRDLVGMAAAAATLAIAPVADAAREPRDQAEEYGVRRPDPMPIERSRIETIFSGWMTEIGLINPANSWADHKPDTSVSYLSSEGTREILNAHLKLLKVADGAISLQVRTSQAGGGEGPAHKPEERTIARTTGINKDAKVVDDAKETLDVAGTKYDCVVKSYELPGRTFKVWSCKDAPLGIVKVSCGDETMKLTKASDTIKTKAGDYDCSVWESTIGETTKTFWRSSKVPGLVVRAVEKNKSTTFTIELTSMKEGK